MFNCLSDFYRSGTWSKFRQVTINERLTADGLIICEHCGKPIYKPYDLILHHIEHLTEENVNDASISLNPENISLVHHRCHNELHERFGFGSGTRHVYLVYGAPCSGKTAYVHSVAQRHDLIVDMDSIFECISVNDRYDKPDSLKAIAFKVRDALLDSIKVNHGRWFNAYVIGGYPMASERERLCQALRAEEVFIDTSYEECIANSKEKPSEWVKYIDDWFARYSPTLT